MAETTTKHTSTPWRVDPGEGRILAEDPRQTIVIPSLGGSFSNPDVAADAAFIVRAVNAHDDLVTALKLLVDDVQDYAAWARPCHALDVAKAALAKAEGAPLDLSTAVEG